ncbi:MAG: DUF3099 domain-containing protein [Dermatophilaceae bacterium]
MRKRADRASEQVFSVTGLPASLQQDQDERVRRYLISMGIRTICFILGVILLAGLHWTIVGWGFVVAAVILPYIAVVMANAARSPQSTALGQISPNSPATPQISPDHPHEDPPK